MDKIGIFNIIFLKMRCPYCGEISKIDFQSKEGEDIWMNEYKVGDKYDKGQFRFIDAIGSCESVECQLEAAKESVWTSGYYGGFSRSFDVYIYCDEKGRITDKVEVYDLNYHLGIMHGKAGELPNDKNYQYKGYFKGKGKQWVSKKVKLRTNGWLDKFQTDTDRWSWETGKPLYETMMFVYNLPDGEEAFKRWFLFRHKAFALLEYLKKEWKLKDEEIASFFLSNEMVDVFDFSIKIIEMIKKEKEKNETRKNK